MMRPIWVFLVVVLDVEETVDASPCGFFCAVVGVEYAPLTCCACGEVRGGRVGVNDAGDCES